MVEPEITGDFYKMVKTELSSAYGTSVSAGYRSIHDVIHAPLIHTPIDKTNKDVWDVFHNGTTHAVMGEPVENIESYDDTFCVYDHVDEFLDELEREGDFR